MTLKTLLFSSVKIYCRLVYLLLMYQLTDVKFLTPFVHVAHFWIFNAFTKVKPTYISLQLNGITYNFLLPNLFKIQLEFLPAHSCPTYYYTLNQ